MKSGIGARITITDGKEMPSLTKSAAIPRLEQELKISNCNPLKIAFFRPSFKSSQVTVLF